MIDNKLTKEMQEFLAIEERTAEDMRHGAFLLLKINKNKALYQNILRSPKRLEDKLVYELKKHLRYRLDGRTLDDVKRMERTVMKNFEELVSSEQRSSSEECGARSEECSSSEELSSSEERGVRSEELSSGDGRKRGKRADHDQLPDEIKNLWEVNAERWKKMKECYETCRSLEMPCDRYEYLVVLSEAYKAYKSDMARYDEYSLVRSEECGVRSEERKGSVNADPKAISSARAYISKARKNYDLLAASDDTADTAAALRERIMARVALLKTAGVEIKADTVEWLKERMMYEF